MTKFYINGFSAFTGDVPTEQFAPYVETRRLRRMENMAKNALFCSFEALKQAGLPLEQPKNMGLSVAVGAGSLENTCKFRDSILDDGDELSSPTAFAGSVHNSTGLALSIFLQLQGPCVTSGQFEASFPAAFLTATSFLEKKMCESVLVVVADDINRVAQSYAPAHPDLFVNRLRNPQGPFERKSAAFVLSITPSGKDPFEVTRIEFKRSADDLSATVNPLYLAQHAVKLLQEKNTFKLEDSFGFTQFVLEATPYVKPQ